MKSYLALIILASCLQSPPIASDSCTSPAALTTDVAYYPQSAYVLDTFPGVVVTNLTIFVTTATTSAPSVGQDNNVGDALDFTAATNAGAPAFWRVTVTLVSVQ
jgi:hypothetical protein